MESFMVRCEQRMFLILRFWKHRIESRFVTGSSADVFRRTSPVLPDVFEQFARDRVRERVTGDINKSFRYAKECLRIHRRRITFGAAEMARTSNLLLKRMLNVPAPDVRTKMSEG
jgi:hypothetical protein